MPYIDEKDLIDLHNKIDKLESDYSRLENLHDGYGDEIIS